MALRATPWATGDEDHAPRFPLPQRVDENTRPAGGYAALPSFLDKFAGLMTGSPGKAGAHTSPIHHRSSFVGGGVHQANGADSPRAARPCSPRYLNATAASSQRCLQRSNSFSSSGARAAKRGAEPLTESSAAAAAAIDPEPPEALRPAAGFGVDRRRLKTDIESNRRLKGSLSLPRREGGIVAIAQPADGALEARPSTALAANHDVLDVAVAASTVPPVAISTISSHDKSIQNAPRSRRGSGVCRKEPLLAAAVPGSNGALGAEVMSSAYGNAAPRKARGMNSPGRERPNPIAQPMSATVDEVQGVTILSSSGSGGVLGLRSGKARGSCSPARERRPPPFEWN